MIGSVDEDWPKLVAASCFCLREKKRKPSAVASNSTATDTATAIPAIAPELKPEEGVSSVGKALADEVREGMLVPIGVCGFGSRREMSSGLKNTAMPYACAVPVLIALVDQYSVVPAAIVTSAEVASDTRTNTLALSVIFF